jgi:hypothetical protein
MILIPVVSSFAVFIFPSTPFRRCLNSFPDSFCPRGYIGNTYGILMEVGDFSLETIGMWEFGNDSVRFQWRIRAAVMEPSCLLNVLMRLMRCPAFEPYIRHVPSSLLLWVFRGVDG